MSAGALPGQGGAIWNGGTLTISACNLSNNVADYGQVGLGGAIYHAGTLTVSNSTLTNNSAGKPPAFDASPGGDGGAIYNAGTLTVSNSTVNDNTAFDSIFGGGYGGGIFNAYKASATITSSNLSGNIADGAGDYNGGGAIYNNGLMTLAGSTVSGNADGIFNDKKGHLTIASKSVVVSNTLYDLFNLGSVKISNDSDVGVIGK